LSIAEQVNEAAGDRMAESAVKGVAGFIHKHRFIAAALIVLAAGLILDYSVRAMLVARDDAQSTRTSVAVQQQQMTAASESIVGMSSRVNSVDAHLNNIDTHMNNIDGDGVETRKLLTKISNSLETIRKQSLSAPADSRSTASVP
jgi:small-conductance mechanosensitive channel